MRYVKFFDPADPENGDWTPVEHIVSETEAIDIILKAAEGNSTALDFYDHSPEAAFLDFVTINWGEIIYDDEETRF